MDADEIKALQEEELEVLTSIYEGDEAFSILNEENKIKRFQYKFGTDGESRSFVLDIGWTSDYPENFPDISVDTFYNRHLKSEVKAKILEKVKAEAEQFLGMSMTYSLFEFVKEHLDEVLEGQPDVIQEVTERLRSVEVEDDDEDSSKPKAKKEQLTKAQKRRMWDKGGLESEERPRGWDWVDVIRHLSQSGGAKD